MRIPKKIVWMVLIGLLIEVVVIVSIKQCHHTKVSATAPVVKQEQIIAAPAVAVKKIKEKNDYFTPSEGLVGAGQSRASLTNKDLEIRTAQLVAAQTFPLLRNEQSLDGVQRITGIPLTEEDVEKSGMSVADLADSINTTSPNLQPYFVQAKAETGLPKEMIEAICFVESYGLLYQRTGKGLRVIQSPTGPTGPMQISRLAAIEMGLIYNKCFGTKTITPTKRIKRHKKWVIITLPKKKVPDYRLVDNRSKPELAIPAAAKYLRDLENGKWTKMIKSRDLAIFAYHCGRGGVIELVKIAEKSEGFTKPITVPQLFFRCSPTYNNKLYDRIQYHLGRDDSPTYWPRIIRAMQLIALYRKDPPAFVKLFSENQSNFDPEKRASNKLYVWYEREDLQYQTAADLKTAKNAGRLVPPYNLPDFYNFQLRSIGVKDPTNTFLYIQASPSAIGALTYIAYETRQLYQALGLGSKKKYVPLEITSLVRSREYQKKLAKSNPNARTEFPSHATGRVFDISYLRLSEAEYGCLRLVLNDLEWIGALDVTRESKVSRTFHVGVNPIYDDFFTKIYKEGVKKYSKEVKKKCQKVKKII